MDWQEIRNKALYFSKRWANAKSEQAEAQLFLHELLEVFGVDSKRIATFEFKVPQGKNRNGYIDMLWKGRILIEMKSRGKNMEKAYAQARNYAFSIESDEDLPEYIMVCDFENICLYRQTTNQFWKFKTKDLSKNIKKLSILTDKATKLDFLVDKELNVKAAYKMSLLHDMLKENNYKGHDLELYLVRLLFCLFADHTGIFQAHQFYEYIIKSNQDGTDLSGRLSLLFDVLNTPKEQRQNSLDDDINKFAYINGGLFKETIRMAVFNSKSRRILLECCEFDWSGISPSIFGSMFQGVMNEKERRELGAHYTSETNILKVIKPLFLDELYNEFEMVKNNSNQLENFHEKLSKLTFLDPACGCGNFLIVTYRELRLLEIEILKMKIDRSSQMIFGEVLRDQIKVNVSQFYGIEYEEFPGQIAQVGMWLMDHQMNNLVAEIFGTPFNRLPLKSAAHIKMGHVEGNALTVEWEKIIPTEKMSYIIGNPPFNGARQMNQNQKKDILNVFGKVKKVGELDYVCAWFKKASDIMEKSNVKTAFVATNSISQGEQVSILWKYLIEQKKMKIDFAYKNFKWNNEAKGNATVHCIIIGFSRIGLKSKKMIFENDNATIANTINPYLVDAPCVWVESRTKPISEVPQMIFGSMPNGKELLLSEDEYEELINKEPLIRKYIRPFKMGKELLNKSNRYCLWLEGVSPKEIQKMPTVIERINKVKESRSNSTRQATKLLAHTPMLFGENRQPSSDYIAIPAVTSEKRKYIPIDILSKDIVAGNKLFIIPDGDLYLFGILTSNVHMAWMRAVCGRLEMRYNYSNTIVYNNFPFPKVNDKQKNEIENAAKMILEARKLYPNDSLAELYENETMPKELFMAHRKLDKVVCKAYGVVWKKEEDCVTDLMKIYSEIVS